MKLIAVWIILTATTTFAGDPWSRHTIDAASRGADGVRLADVNGDGQPDTVTGWEEGGQIRVCLNPGPTLARDHWPSVLVGRVRSPEDAVFADLDRDGVQDIVSSCEGGQRTVFIHWGPADFSNVGQLESKWKTEALPASEKAAQWMYCLPLQVDGRNGIDLVCGAKGSGAQVGWFEAPRNARNMSEWKWHSMYRAGWIMSLFADDVDGDGDQDVVLTDRKGGNRGCHWLVNPGPGDKQTGIWTTHNIGAADREVMFAASGDFDGDGIGDIACNVRGGDIVLLRRTAANSLQWTESLVKQPQGIGTGKGISITDVDLNGKPDLVCTCENAKGKVGVFWLSCSESPFETAWTFHDISGAEEGVKFDLIQLLDLDQDGDQDVITCEERDNLGLIWYENPAR